MTGDHLLRLEFGRFGPTWSLTCHHDLGAYPTYDEDTGEEMSPECWSVDWFDNAGVDDLLALDGWPDRLAFPMPVRPVWDDGLILEYDGPPPSDPAAPMEGKVNTPSTETAVKAARNRTNMIAWGNDRTRLLVALDHEWSVAVAASRCAGHLAADGGATAAKLADRFGWSRNQTAARMQELRELGLVEYRTHDDKIITARTNVKGTARGRVQFITEQGMAAVRKLSATAP